MGHVGPGATCVIMSDAQEFQMISGWADSHVYVGERCSMTLDGICLAEGHYYDYRRRLWSMDILGSSGV